ncbi:GvpL/GvpF family gas vesicle protein [Calderihabitans maritimus]|uniref:Gas vesicle synthesis GvpLGvpF n=1 Tax=Calderihabitans maritimus TaxID=1246530 RepID=A0A1Z5HXD9_9FIRM|nr:GvpL/GvpF family gas vesicle protein [Calderihabitans maritimus]GAW93975.1 hypothetical protein PTH_0426 [Calderihabitans maritimus]
MSLGVYLYCIVKSSQYFVIQHRGMHGRDIYSIPYRSLEAIVSDLAGRTVDIREENILLHDQVVEEAMQHGTVLPVRFGTVFHGREMVVSLLRKYYSMFERKLSELEDKVEFGLKIIWPGEQLKAKINAEQQNSQLWTNQTESTPGKQYLLKKLREYRIQRSLEEQADKLIGDIDAELRLYAEAGRLSKLRTERLLLDAVYLVRKEQYKNYQEKVEQIKQKFPSLKFLSSGPWPPYNFAGFEQPLSIGDSVSLP